MSVTLLQQPAAVAFSRNPVLFRFQSDALRAVTGKKYIGQFGLIAYFGDYTFTLKYNGITLAFTAVDAPDASGYQLSAGKAGQATIDYVTQLAGELASNFYLNKDFALSVVGAPFFAVQFTARKTGDAYNLSLIDGTVNLTQQQAGVTEQLQPNFKLYTELWVENKDHSDFVKVSDAFLEVDENGEADIDLSDPLTNVLLSDGYDRPNVRFPVAQQNELSCRRYYYQVAEAYGATQTIRKMIKTPIKTILLGGISKEKLEEFDFPGYFISGNLLRFLKQEPQAVAIRPEQQEYLTLVTFNQSFARLSIHFKIYFTDGTTVTREGDVFSDVQQYQKFTWPVGFEQNHFHLLDPVRIVQKYEVTALNEASAAVSETKTYILDYDYKPYTRFFLYLSSFGSYDTKLTFGKNSNAYEVVSSSATRTLQGDFHLIDGEQIDYVTTLNNTETYTTGYRPMAVIRSFRDLFLSLDKIVLRKNKAYPVVFASKTINEYKDGENLHALSFEMGFRFRETLWTYDELDDQPVHLYLPGTGNTSLPMPTLPNIPIDYFDGRYYLKTETYNRIEIDAKLAALKAQIGTLDQREKDHYDTLILQLQSQANTFNSLNNTYYNKQEIDNLLQLVGSGSGSGNFSFEIIPISAAEYTFTLTPDRIAKFGTRLELLTFKYKDGRSFRPTSDTYFDDHVTLSFGSGAQNGQLYVLGPYTGSAGGSGATATLITRVAGDILGSDPDFYLDLSGSAIPAFPTSIKVFVNYAGTANAADYKEIPTGEFMPGSRFLKGFFKASDFPNAKINISYI